MENCACPGTENSACPPTDGSMDRRICSRLFSELSVWLCLGLLGLVLQLRLVLALIGSGLVLALGLVLVLIMVTVRMGQKITPVMYICPSVPEGK